MSIPTDNLNSAAGAVAFPALSRLQDDPVRLRSYFLKGYSLVLGCTIPITIVSAIFAEELIQVVLGPKWEGTGQVFRLLAPTIMILAMINPLAWVLFSLGLVGRSLKVAAVLAPIVITGYVVGLPYGPKGVALGYSTMMALWALPHIAWCVRGTSIALRDVLVTLSRPLGSGIAAGLLPLALKLMVSHLLPPLVLLLLGGALFLAGYAGMLLGVMGQKRMYMDVLRGMRGSAPATESIMASI